MEGELVDVVHMADRVGFGASTASMSTADHPNSAQARFTSSYIMVRS